jgi:hypothetical protein
MGHLELILLATTSYLGSLWVLERWRRSGRKPSLVSLAELGRPHLRRVLAPVVRAIAPLDPEGARAAELLAALEGRDPELGRQLSRDLAPGLGAPTAALLEAAVELVAASTGSSSFARYRAAVRARRASRRARPVGIEAVYLEILILLGFLSDGLTEDLRLLQSKRLLRRISEPRSEDPLVQLAAALQSAASGQPAEAVAALARAFYHARDDRFIAGLILAAPFVEELSPSLREEARRALAEAPVRAVR